MSGTKKESNEQKTAAASYVITFYQTVQELTSQYANYCNVIEELNFKYGEEAIDKLEGEDRQATITVTQNLKYYVRHVYVQWQTTKEAAGITDKESKKLEKQYEDLLKDFVPQKKNVQEFVVTINKYMASSIMKELLHSSQDLVESLYE